MQLVFSEGVVVCLAECRGVLGTPHSKIRKVMEKVAEDLFTIFRVRLSIQDMKVPVIVYCPARNNGLSRIEVTER
jgi:hypothetical protein